MKNAEALQSRRSFMKKAAYAAPVVMSLGALMSPVNAEAVQTVSTLSKNIDITEAKLEVARLQGNQAKIDRLQAKLDRQNNRLNKINN